jgi:hypothetical protein
MGKIAEALRSNLRSLAESDARNLRDLDQELRALRDTHTSEQQVLPQRPEVKALLGGGTFQQQTVAALKRICKENGIKGVSKLRKAELAARLMAEGVSPPPRPIESFSKKELITLVKQLLESFTA